MEKVCSGQVSKRDLRRILEADAGHIQGGARFSEAQYIWEQGILYVFWEVEIWTLIIYSLSVWRGWPSPSEVMFFLYGKSKRVVLSWVKKDHLQVKENREPFAVEKQLLLFFWGEKEKRSAGLGF